MKKSSMKKSIALGLALAMGTSLLAACGGSATTSSSRADIFRQRQFRDRFHRDQR